MPLTCNAVGDILALLQLAIEIATFVADYRHAPAECRALLQDLRSMERLLALAHPTIREIKDPLLKEAVVERLRVVSQRVHDALGLVAKFRSASDSAPADPGRGWQTTTVNFVTRQSERVMWALKRSSNAEACRVAIAQSFEPLVLALLLAWKADQASVLSVIQQSLDDLSRHVTVGQDAVRQDLTHLIASHDKLEEALEASQEQIHRALFLIARNVQATYTNTIHLRRDQAVGMQAVLTLGVKVEDGFSQVDGRLSDMERVHREQAELLTQFMANPLGFYFTRLLSSFSYTTTPTLIASSGPSEVGSALTVRSSIDTVTSRPIIIGALVLAGRVPARVEQLGWVGVAFTLFIMRLLYRLYKVPVVVHIIFVKGFCDEEYELPIADARSAQSLHHALTRRLAGKVGDVLLSRGKYEVHKRVGPTTTASQTIVWTDLSLNPGDKIELAALVERFMPANSDPHEMVCLSCSKVIPTMIGAEPLGQHDGPRWTTCPRCSAVVQVSSVMPDNYPPEARDGNDDEDRIEPEVSDNEAGYKDLEESVVDDSAVDDGKVGDGKVDFDPVRATAGAFYNKSSSGNKQTEDKPATEAEVGSHLKSEKDKSSLSVEETLRHCRRVHLILAPLKHEMTSPATSENIFTPALVASSTLLSILEPSRSRMASRTPSTHGLSVHITPRTAPIYLHTTPLPRDGFAFVEQTLDHDDEDPYLLSHSSYAPTLSYSVEKRKVRGAERPVLAVLLPESDLDSDVATLGSSIATKGSSRKSREELTRIAALLDMRGRTVWQRDSGWVQIDDWLARSTNSSRRFQAVDRAWYTWSWRKGNYKCFNERHYFVASYEIDPASIAHTGILAISPSFMHLAPQILTSFIIARHIAEEVLIAYLSQDHRSSS